MLSIFLKKASWLFHKHNSLIPEPSYRRLHDPVLLTLITWDVLVAILLAPLSEICERHNHFSAARTPSLLDSNFHPMKMLISNH